jgi:fucose permease
MGLSAFIADISKPDQRAFRMGMIHLSQSLGRPIAAPLGAYLLKEGNEIRKIIHKKTFLHWFYSKVFTVLSIILKIIFSYF